VLDGCSTSESLPVLNTLDLFLKVLFSTSEFSATDLDKDVVWDSGLVRIGTYNLMTLIVSIVEDC